MTRAFSVCLIIFILIYNVGFSQPPAKSLVDLKGKLSYTILKNSTSDTLNINGWVHYNLPYYEETLALQIPPGSSDTIVISLAYPDFIKLFSHDFFIRNAPGKRVVCDIKSIRRGNLDVKFSGDLTVENEYYLAYQNHFKGWVQESTPYYIAGARVDMNKFPAIADSLTNIGLSYLRAYRDPLPAAFRIYEELRLKYNGAFRKYNVLFDREFKSGHKIQVDTSYFRFEKEMPLDISTDKLSTEFLNYAGFYIFYHSGQSHALAKLMRTLDELVPLSETRDAIKMKMMSNVYKSSESEYSKILPSLVFSDEKYKLAVDSITMLKHKYPIVGKKMPRIKLLDINGDSVLLSDFTGKSVIVNFWASWCAPCIKEFPIEKSLHEKYSSNGVLVVNICVETDREKWKEMSSKHNLTMINLYATEKEYSQIRSTCNIGFLPRSILIDVDHQVLSNYYKQASQIVSSDMDDLIKYKSKKKF